MANLIERHRDRIRGVLSCFDRIVIQGTLPSVCHAGAMATMLDGRDIRMFDYFTRFAQPFRESIRAHAERVAAEEGVEVEYIKRPKGYRKEDRIREIAPVAGMTAASVANPLAIAAIVAGSAVAKWTKQATTTQAIPLSKSTSLNLRSRVFR